MPAGRCFRSLIPGCIVLLIGLAAPNRGAPCAACTCHANGKGLATLLSIVEGPFLSSS